MTRSTAQSVAMESTARPDLRGLHGALLLVLFALPIFVPGLGYWPLYAVVPLALYAVIVWTCPPLRHSVGWLRRGRLDGDILAAGAGIAVVSSVALMLWFVLLKPDVRALTAMIPAWPLWALVPLGMVFAAVNALLEEVIWRGILFDAFVAQLGNRGAVIAQAIGFGIVHAHGFPNGALGMIMAGIYGLMLGWLRLRAHGLAAPILTHICADATIFAVLVTAAG
jgi:membrane protease YdiL (CAAX protease family)